MKENKPLSNEEIASFCGQTAMLFQAAIPPVESMHILLSDTKSSPGRALIQKILDVCQTGEPFWKALENTGVFPVYVIKTLALGEESGNLDVCMLRLAAYYEKEDSVADSIKSAITYPLLMIVMMAVVIFILISRVMPIFEQVYVELGSELTGFSASLLRLGNNLNRYSVVFLALAVLLLLCYFVLTKTRGGKNFLLRFLTVFPLTRSFYESVACERFANGMAIALSSGMDTFASLDMISALVGSRSMQNKISQCKEAILKGDNFSEALVSSGIFNNLYSQMIGIGFRSGNIDTVLYKIAEDCEKETDRKIQSIISVLEPTLVIILSLIVGMILLSVILPLMGIMTSIG